MVDFAKLRDPVYRAEMAARREAEEAIQEAKDAKIREAIDTCLKDEYMERLSSTERSFIRSCDMRVRTYSVLTEKQLKWLFDLAAKAPK